MDYVQRNIETEPEQEINFKKLDDFRAKKFYVQLLCEYQALLQFQDYLPAPASIRKELRNIAQIHKVGFTAELTNEEAVLFKFNHNKNECIVTIDESPQIGPAVITPSIQWIVENGRRYMLVQALSLDDAARKHAAKIALAALSKAVTSESSTFVGDVVNKLMDDAMWIFKEFWEAKPQTPAGVFDDSALTPIRGSKKPLLPGLPPRPPLPQGDDLPLSVWFKYYHDCKVANYKITLRDIARLSGYSHNTTKKQHSLTCPYCVK